MLMVKRRETAEHNKIEVYVDGLAEPVNPGVACYGYVIYVDGVKYSEGYGALGIQSNNYAEYMALIKALEEVKEKGLRGSIMVRSDSQLLVRQLTGWYEVRSPNIWPLYTKAYSLISELGADVRWIPRTQNEEADTLSRKAYEEYLDQHPEVVERFREYFATEKQKRFMEKLGIPYERYIGKREASKRISRRLEELGRQPKEETCITCRWVGYSGPHIGCYYGGRWQRWIPKEFAYNYKCPNYEPKEV